ncbi:Pet127-domain-containing protein [Ramicandelaber brevisporus]|nr:Pet127-domain-containing protein [Ramicandelaber brevisporus]
MPNDYTVIQSPNLRRVPRLAHRLDRVLFSPGVHYLQDPRSRVYNFDPFLRNITEPDHFDYDAIAPYITSSRDAELVALAKAYKRRFVGSTSSMTHMLSHLWYNVSSWRQADISPLSIAFADMPRSQTTTMRAPASVFLRSMPGSTGIYAIDADKSFDVRETVLSLLGRSMEKLLTSSQKEYEECLKANKKQRTNAVQEVPQYVYAKMDDFILRAQIDCYDPRLPRPTFDIKTRACISVRLDAANHKDNWGYQIHQQHGLLESYEREYYDMIRAAFLKYSFQARIGNMDGVMVTYHNTARVFGFQYVSVDEMDARLNGNRLTGDMTFSIIMKLFRSILSAVVRDAAPGRTLLVTFDSRMAERELHVYVEDVGDYTATRSAYDSDLALSTNGEQSDRNSDPFGSDANQTSSDPFSSPASATATTTAAASGTPSMTSALPRVTKYVVAMYSTVDGKDTDQPVTLNPDCKINDVDWHVNVLITRLDSTSPEFIARQYRSVRRRQLAIFGADGTDDQGSDDTNVDVSTDGDSSGRNRLRETLRKISRRGLHLNEEKSRHPVIYKPFVTKPN